MRDIYASAARIVIWLGEDADDSDAAVGAWRRLAKQSRDRKRSHSALEISEREVLALHHLQQRDYWRRVWVLQEASTFSVTREIWCGDSCVPFDGAVIANEVMRNRVVGMGQLPSVNPWILELGVLAAFERLRSGSQNAGGDAQLELRGRNFLLDMIYKTRDLEASNPRDKIYALMPVYSDMYRGPLPKADYNRPVEKAFRDAAVHILSQEQDPRCFLLCTDSGPLASGHSWVPNFRRIPRISAVFDCHDKFGASGDMAPRLFINPSREEVTFRGTRIDTVREVHRPLATTNDQESSTSAAFWQARFDAWVTSLARFFFSDGADRAYARGGLLSEAVDRLLALDCCPGLVMERTGQVPHWLPLRNIAARDAAPPRLEDVRRDFTDMLLRVGHASLFWTSSGFVGLGDPSIRARDLVVVCFGLSVPLLIRESALFYRMQGPCVVQGVMDGEALEQGNVKDFTIY